MFTIEQIKTAHSKVKSGADFPTYIREIKLLGVRSFETFVSDSHSEYFGSNNFKTASEAQYETLEISKNVDPQQFTSDLKSHQQGHTDYVTFCRDCAKSGIEKWICDLEKMTCTYCDVNADEILVERIPNG